MQISYETPRLLLRQFEYPDAGTVQNLAGHIEVARSTLYVPHPYEDGMAESWIGYLIKARVARTEFTYAVILKESGQLVGASSIIYTEKHNRAELAYWVGVPYWKCGIGTEAAAVLLTGCFESLPVVKVFAAHFLENTASGRIMEKLGMKREGILRSHFSRWNRQVDSVYYGILRNEWEEKSGSKRS